ncbi:kinase-like domain-containing protein [Massariosphaeria phaeospora]|uniref:Kinase-like domain-containing protein n=1 Tax=Massariosphaeria phaeospora TaxID=100035 RepID=A0A7C8I6U0_9PLEO|nr:kinase-like domain-containing protein [Massariosphaeria phaeospora]
MPANMEIPTPEPSDTLLIQMCQSAPLIAGSYYGNRIVRLSDTLVAKYGMGVWSEEARNQEYAYVHTDSSILYVPRVYRYFEDHSQGSRVGYLIMEYVRGTRLDSVEIDPYTMEAVARAIAHLSTIPVPASQGPGSVVQGVARGYLWPPEGVTFNAFEDMQAWFNSRLAVVGEKRLDLISHPLVMRHMDLVRRNIILKSDSSVCFLDWAFAGFYPELFEIRYLRDLHPVDPAWSAFLLKYMRQPTVDEEQILAVLAIPAAVNERYFFG